VTAAELWHALEQATGAYKSRRLQYLLAILHVLPVIPYTEQTAYEHARISATLDAAGKRMWIGIGMGFWDVVVAATALERGGEVATFNRRHFSQVKGLKLIEPK
jgi:predicted nucleic acid-binding protein